MNHELLFIVFLMTHDSGRRRNTRSRRQRFVSQLLKGGLERTNGRENVAIANKAEVTDAEDFPFQVVLSPRESNIKALSHHGTNLF